MDIRLKKAALTALLIAMLPTMAPAEDTAAALEQVLVLTMRDGTTQRVSMADNPRTTVENGVLKVRTAEAEMAFPLDNVGTFTFEQQLAGIEAIDKDDEDTYGYENGLLTVRTRSGKPVSVYSVDGREVTRVKTDTGGECRVDMSGYQQGVYIVSIGNKSFKIYKR